MTGLEKAVWWTEYVLRNNGTKFFENSAASVPLYQYLLLDVIGFLLLLVFGILYFISKLIKFVIYAFNRHASKKQKKN